MRSFERLDEVYAHYEPVIGLEVHAQLKTESKLFSGASAAFDPDHPNSHVTAYCIGLPGVLPRLNRRAVEMAIRAGLAVGCTIRETSSWARKHYFYPDLSKGYQISQYEAPICEHGTLTIDTENGPRTIRIGRIHMEEDAGKSIHVEGLPRSVVDYNRAGVPLIEIVSEPDLRTPAEASTYLKALRAILMALDVCDGNLEEGSFRCDANVSIRPRGQAEYGTRVELKNINSFRFVEQAIEVEILRHAAVLERGERIEQETRLFDSQKKETRSMRSKEDAHDYRYFPDPDLPPLKLDPAWIESIRQSLPELPAAQLARYRALGLGEDEARAFTEEPALARYFEAAERAYPDGARAIALFIKDQVMRELKDDPRALETAQLKPEVLAELVRLKEAQKISSTQQKKLFAEIWRSGKDLAALLASEGEQLSDEAALLALVDQVIARCPAEVEQFRAGKAQILGFLVGQAMKASKGKANPPLLKSLFERRLKGD